ncbi:MAG: hypothetical protein PHP96_01160 [Candidatus Dojkabacteria bacterium]|nr:hypothetical protein [Candidatus Dojkabacteria bacterium]
MTSAEILHILYLTTMKKKERDLGNSEMGKSQKSKYMILYVLLLLVPLVIMLIRGTLM